MAQCENKQTGNNPLFPGIMPPMAEAHKARGVEVAGQVQKIDGKCVAVFVGMSNFRQETQATMRLIKAAGVRHILFHNACRGAWDLRRMVERANDYWSWVKMGLAKRNITTNQVQVLFVKNSVRLGAAAGEFESLMNEHLDRAIREFPNLQQIFISSAIYSGYASKPVRTEPGAWLEGKAVDAVVKARAGTSPWTGFGPYLWADGIRPRADGLVWNCADFELDGIHPGPFAEAKVAEMFVRFLNSSPVTEWYRGF